jgi:hypothetical protein
MARLLSLAFVSLLILACGVYFLASSKKGFEATEMKRAAFDLQCTADNLEVYELAEGSTPVTPGEIGKGGQGTVIGVRGCGRQASYKYDQERGWVAQTNAKLQ